LKNLRANLLNLRSKKLACKISLLELNVQTDIELSDESEKLLARAGII